ncbi:hypothetical protein D3C85_755680 [compost metagenome]
MTAGIDMILLNKDSLALNIFEYWDEAFASLPVQEFKYKRWDWAYDKGVPKVVNPLLQKMFDLMPPDQDLRWLVDYKVRELKAGDCGCKLEGWHLDVVESPWHDSKPDFHLIYSTEVGTDFLAQPIPSFQDDGHFLRSLEPFNLDYLENHRVVSSKPNHVSAYNRYQLHRGPIVKRDCKRMLLRLTATEVIK